MFTWDPALETGVNEIDEQHRLLIRSALASTARLAVIPLQDLLELGSDARMNRPGEPAGNWCWRCPPRALSRSLARRIHGLVKMYGRLVK
jgi:4-alpha-glucanotransferase